MKSTNYTGQQRIVHNIRSPVKRSHSRAANEWGSDEERIHHTANVHEPIEKFKLIVKWREILQLKMDLQFKGD